MQKGYRSIISEFKQTDPVPNGTAVCQARSYDDKGERDADVGRRVLKPSTFIVFRRLGAQRNHRAAFACVGQLSNDVGGRGWGLLTAAFRG